MIDGTTADGSTDNASEVARLERRWQREREARLEAEQLAESGLRSLWEAKNDLDRRVEERTAELVRTRALAEASERAKTRFLADLAHQVRTPLQTILAAIELATPATPQDRDRLSVAADAAVELRDLFTNLMRLAELQVNPQPPRPTEVDLRDLADDLAIAWRERMLSRGLLLVPHADGRALVDPDRLSQAADALLDNAVRFAVPGPVELHLTSAPDGVRLRVVDSGPGLADDLLEAAFVPFTTFGAGSTGGGIGLALVRELALTAGGTATATSGHGEGPGDGLSVEFLLPVEGGQAAAGPADRRVGPDRRRTVHSAPTEGDQP
ncbi:MAG: sensor histidine kinase [Microthrixaceae bacterium]|jgi:signal transduction histidine kinase